MKKQLEKQIEQIAGIINLLEKESIDAESLFELDELLDLLSYKIKSTKLGNPLLSQSRMPEAIRHEAIFIFDTSLKVYKYTGAFDHLFYPSKEGALYLSDLLHLEEPETFTLETSQLFANKKAREFETKIASPQGVPIPARVNLELLSDEKGKELVMAGINFSHTTTGDIQSYQQIIIDNLPDIDIFLFDNQYRYVLAGGREKERFGLTNSYFSGKTLFEAYNEKIHKRLFPFYRKALDGEMADGEIRIADQIYYIWAKPVLNFYDEVVGGTAIVQNVTKDKAVEMHLKKAKEDAQKADQAKSVFLANMSHEIRTPLNAIIGFTEQLGKSRLNKQQQKFLNLINESSEHLLSLVNEILILFKLGMGKVYIDNTPFSISQVLNVLYNSFIASTNEKKLHLAVQIDPEIPDTLVGDPFRIKQIIINLLSNAIKYTDSGKISMRCRLGATTKNKVKVIFEVEDTGTGIPPDILPSIFDEFFQSESQLDKKRKGVGLGLTICKNLAELMGGEIRVKSELGKGSLFSVVLPFEKAGKEEKVENETHYLLKENLLEGKKVLFADDDEYNLLLAETILKNWRTDFDLATNGEEALALMNKNKYDICLLDIHMPKMSGIGVVEAVRNNPGNLNHQVKMLAVTANVLKSDMRVYLNSGFDGYVLKPFKEAELYNKVCNILRILHLPQQRPLKKASTSRKKKQVDLFDTSELLITANGDSAFFNKMIDTFVRNSRDISRQINLALSNENWEELGEKVHRAIPSFKYFGLKKTVRKLLQLEKLALREKVFHDIPRHARVLLVEIDEIIAQAEKAALTD